MLRRFFFLLVFLSTFPFSVKAQGECENNSLVKAQETLSTRIFLVKSSIDNSKRTLKDLEWASLKADVSKYGATTSLAMAGTSIILAGALFVEMGLASYAGISIAQAPMATMTMASAKAMGLGKIILIGSIVDKALTGANTYLLKKWLGDKRNITHLEPEALTLIEGAPSLFEIEKATPEDSVTGLGMIIQEFEEMHQDLAQLYETLRKENQPHRWFKFGWDDSRYVDAMVTEKKKRLALYQQELELLKIIQSAISRACDLNHSS